MLGLVKRLTILAAIVATTACGGSSSTTSPSGGGQASGKGTLTATIDGVAYTGTINSATLQSSGLLNIASNSSDLTRSVNFAVQPAAVGTFSGASSAIQLNVITTSGGAVTGSWLTSLNFGSGSLTITSLSSTGVSGTFAFTAVPATASTPSGNKVVTNGAFTATF